MLLRNSWARLPVLVLPASARAFFPAPSMVSGKAPVRLRCRSQTRANDRAAAALRSPAAGYQPSEGQKAACRIARRWTALAIRSRLGFPAIAWARLRAAAQALARRRTPNEEVQRAPEMPQRIPILHVAQIRGGKYQNPSCCPSRIPLEQVKKRKSINVGRKVRLLNPPASVNCPQEYVPEVQTACLLVPDVHGGPGAVQRKHMQLPFDRDGRRQVADAPVTSLIL